jgi:hypothetical protein
MNNAIITFRGKSQRVICDRRCDKAWGKNLRPSIQLSDDPDDFYYLLDDKVGTAPENPGTYEGLEMSGKPASPDDFPTKWCVRECERCARYDLDWSGPLIPISFDTIDYNMPWLHEDKND